MADAHKRKRHANYKTRYRIKNWSLYEEGLKARGDITLWFSGDVMDAWLPNPTGKPGRQSQYSELAMETILTLRLVFKLPLRQAVGFVNSLLFGDFDNNDVGDVITGLDDDGDAASAWFYPGTTEESTYGIDSSACVEAFDLNPADEAGNENPGVSGSAHNFDFDFDFDGMQDVIVGYRYQNSWTRPSKTLVLFGVGDGTFGAPVQVRDFPTSNYGNEFAVPKRVCARFPMELSD